MMPEKFRRHFLKTREAKSLLVKASEKLKVDLEQVFKAKVSVELVETEFAEIVFVDGRPLLAKVGANVFPTLVFNELFALAPKVVVDMGAVPHVCNGANVMAPGIRRFEGEFRKGDFVLVVDERHGKPIAVGEIMYDAGDAEKVLQGAVARNVHFVGDKIWNFIKKLDAKV
jgi:PUA-domain protein